MTFVNFSLLAGAALVALPILLHLIMRRRPTLLEFPALRFIQKRHDTNQRSLRLRHLLLLLLRAGAIALLAFALARPSVKLGGSLGSQESPVAAVLIFDAAPRMEYRHNNQTRLESAKELGTWLVAQLPEQSEIGVLDSRVGSAAAFQADRGAAKDRIERLEVAANSQSLPLVVDAAVRLLRQSELPRKEIYLFTDLSRGAWPVEQAARLQQQLTELADVGVYVLDVGIAKPTDCGLGDIRLSGEVLSNRSMLTVGVDLSSMAVTADRTVELQLLDAEGKVQDRREQTCQAMSGELRPLEFRLKELEPGVHQGVLRILGQDGLAADDTRYFTVVVKPGWKILLAAPRPAPSYALFLTEALAPTLSIQRGKATRFDCSICDLEELAKRPLGDYAAVCVLDPTPLEPAVWRRLAEYAADGHGVGVFLGRNASPVDSFNTTEAQEVLPGKLLRTARRPDGDLHLAPRDDSHPILSAFRGSSGGVPWKMFPVYRYWELGEPPTGAAAVIPYSDGFPALWERPIGQGRGLTMTTPVSERPDQTPWNLLPVGDAWPFMILANQMMTYLVGGSDQQLNYFAGQTAVVQLDTSAQRQSYMLFAPDNVNFPIPAELNRRSLAITATDQVGNYRLRAGGEGGSDFGFSVNYAPNQTRLDRMADAELAELFGPIKFRLAQSRDQIDRDISVGRVGRELYPLLILIVAVVLAMEMLLANRFYKE